MQTSIADLIGTRSFGFASYPPSLGEQRLGLEEFQVAVEPETCDRDVESFALLNQGSPLRRAKVHRPLLPEETLPRPRLFDWFAARKQHRVFYVTAEAGFGKTTLVADYLRRSMTRTFWYRLDDEETDGLVFLRYVVASCQAVDARLLARSSALLTEISLEPVTLEVVLQSVLAEMESLGEMPSAIVLDDYHIAESVPGIDAVLERLIARAPAELKFIFAGRRTPRLASASLRGRGKLAELGKEDLRFDEAETERLFRDAYHHAFEPDVLHDLYERTDGWAASLQLVKTAVEGRSPTKVRAFVRSLSGAEGNLHDYLAEEVVGDLEPDQHEFLVRTSILDDVEPNTAAIVAGVTSAEAVRLLDDAQRLGLMSKSDDEPSTWQAHPLVREFLLAHLEAEVGEPGVAAMHRQVAAAIEPRSWLLAARHWSAAGEGPEVRRVVCGAIQTVIGTGDLAVADELMNRHADDKPNPWHQIVTTRLLMSCGRYSEAVAMAQTAEAIGEAHGISSPVFAQSCALNRLHLGLQLGDLEALATAAQELSRGDDPELAAIARSSELLAGGSNGGSLDALCRALVETAELNRRRGHNHHEGISLTNLCYAEIARGNLAPAISSALAALSLFESGASSIDLAAAHMGAARGMALAGRWEDALSHVQAVAENSTYRADSEGIAEAAEIHAMFGDAENGRDLLAQMLVMHPEWACDEYWKQVSARLDLLLLGPDDAAAKIANLGPFPRRAGFGSMVRSLAIQIRASSNSPDDSLIADVAETLRFAERQQAWLWWKNTRLTQAILASTDEFASYVRCLQKADYCFLSIQAELVARRLGDLDGVGFEMVKTEALGRPNRWRRPLRAMVANKSTPTPCLRRAVELLEVVGESQDVPALRAVAKRRSVRLPDAGRPLIRRLAPRVYVEDLGRVSVRVGDKVLTGFDIRKKVLSLLCFLLTRPQLSATREQIFEALWPEMDPEAGANSLNQSTYFLRRILEPGREEEDSAGYVRSKADLLWLDGELINCRSADCLKLIAGIRRDPSPGLVERLAETYRGRYAIDFMYDEWASAFRESLHASYLDRVERAIVHDIKAGFLARGLSVAQMALQADPDADQIELCLLRLYRRMGASAAAAEQYAHYAGVMRNQMGIEPPPLDSI
jgi:LuxR family maltose regulon positive regulatory protein